MVCTSGKCGSRPEHMLPRELLVASFFAQSVVVFASNGGYLGGLTNVEVGEKYRTLFMPAGWAFAIWGLIYAWELLAYGSALFDPHPSPQLEAAAVYLIAANASQLLWAVAFCREWLRVSCVFIAGIAVALMFAAEELRGGPAAWTFGYVTSLHGGWVLAATLLNANLVAARDGGERVQLAAAFASAYAALAPGAVACATRGDAAFALAIAWALVAVGAEVADGEDAARGALRLTAFGAAGALLWLAASAVLFDYVEGWHDEL